MPGLGAGYLRTPTINGDQVVFVCDDDLWLVPAQGGRAFRLTAGVAEPSGPRLSPDGRLLAFVGREEGPADVYVMPASGGTAQRLTFVGGTLEVAGFTPDGDIVFTTDAERPFFRDRRLYRLSPGGGLPEELPFGAASAVGYETGATAGATAGAEAGNGAAAGKGAAAGTGVVLGRVAMDPARWKRYRGGRVGDLWVDPTGGGEFRRLLRLDGNLADPCWVGGRIFFLADHEGVGNVYSVTPAGEDLRRHTDHHDFYARNLTTDGRRLVYQAGAEIWLLDPAGAEAGAGAGAGAGDAAGAGPRRIDIDLASSRTQRRRQFVPAERHLDSAVLAPDGARMAVTARGKAYLFGNWAGPVRQYGEPDGVRYRLLTPLAGENEERLVAAASDEGDRERLVVLGPDGASLDLTQFDVGRVVELVASPVGPKAAVTNHRNELLLLDLTGESPALTTVDHSRYDRIADPAWSPDGRWLAYTHFGTAQTSAIKVAELATGETFAVTRPVLTDNRPAFDPEGRYLYFVGQRHLDPVYDEVQFDLSFPLGSRPYAVTLRADTPAPFVPQVEPLHPADQKPDQKPDQKSDQKADQTPAPAEGEPGGAPTVRIDRAGIERRVVPLPVPDGRYVRIGATAEKVFFTSRAVVGTRDRDTFAVAGGDQTLEAYDLKRDSCEQIATGVSAFRIGSDHRTLFYRSGDRLRVVRAGEKPSDSGHDQPGRESGWIDLDRVKVSVHPGAEWRQMFREAWRLQREGFWVEDMSGVDWDAVYDLYLPLVDRVSTRAEFSDLLWELQGELGTSHAYEFGGAYRSRPHYRQGYLGVDWACDPETGEFRIARVLEGDPWSSEDTPPFHRPGVDVVAGDEMLAVNGAPVGRGADGVLVTPAERLVNQAEQEVELTVRRDGGPPRTVVVRALADERPARYRDWVDANRAQVHARTDGRVGYLHVPDMAPAGFAEFHRGFLVEYDREALIVDVRFNRGGHVSPLLLEKLARRRIGYQYARWGVPTSYPDTSPRGHLVALTNEAAGSDGDIFSHAFKLMGLGPLVGKRTWGGVIGIWPRHRLADGTLTSQPEFSFAFDDVGWRVENYGTDPDIDVDVAPQDYAAGRDPQLDRAIGCALESLARRPPHSPDPADRPRLGRPTLPPR